VTDFVYNQRTPQRKDPNNFTETMDTPPQTIDLMTIQPTEGKQQTEEVSRLKGGCDCGFFEALALVVLVSELISGLVVVARKFSPVAIVVTLAADKLGAGIRMKSDGNAIKTL